MRDDDRRREQRDDDQAHHDQDQPEFIRDPQRTSSALVDLRTVRRQGGGPDERTAGDGQEKPEEGWGVTGRPAHTSRRPSLQAVTAGPYKSVALQPAVASRRANSVKNCRLHRGATARELRRLSWQKVVTRAARALVGSFGRALGGGIPAARWSRAAAGRVAARHTAAPSLV